MKFVSRRCIRKYVTSFFASISFNNTRARVRVRRDTNSIPQRTRQSSVLWRQTARVPTLPLSHTHTLTLRSVSVCCWHRVSKQISSRVCERVMWAAGLYITTNNATYVANRACKAEFPGIRNGRCLPLSVRAWFSASSSWVMSKDTRRSAGSILPLNFHKHDVFFLNENHRNIVPPLSTRLMDVQLMTQVTHAHEVSNIVLYLASGRGRGGPGAGAKWKKVATVSARRTNEGRFYVNDAFKSTFTQCSMDNNNQTDQRTPSHPGKTQSWGPFARSC